MSENTTRTGSTDHTIALVHALYEGHNGHDAQTVSELYRPDGTHTDVAFGEPTAGRDAIRNLLIDFYRVFPDITFEIHDLLADHRLASVRYTFRATMHQDGFGYTATQQPIVIRGVQIFEIDDGEIEATEDFWDFATFDRQLRPSSS